LVQAVLGTLVRMVVVALMIHALLAQAPLPPKPPPPAAGERSAIKTKIAEMHPSGKLEQDLLALARTYLDRSNRTAPENPFVSTRDLVAAGALAHAVDHQQHMLNNPAPPPPSIEEITRHLDRVYFRLQQADYFVKQSVDPDAKAIAAFAREYYERAVKARDRSEARTADESAKSADECMRALESLAQASVAVPPPRPPGPPAHPSHLL